MGVWNIKPPKITKIISQNKLEDTNSLSQSRTIVVVSVFGPSQSSIFPECKSGEYKKAFQLAIDAFGSLELSNSNNTDYGSESSNTHPAQSDEGSTTISGFYNEEESLIILCLDGVYDSDICLKAFQATSGKNFMTLWSELKSSYCQALLLLFSLSHVIILSNVGSYFDTSYIMLFRALEIFRSEMQTHISDLLSDIPGLPDSWIEHARLCSPRLLFVFPVENIETTKYPTPGSLQPDPMTKLRIKLENEIYQILRKCRIVTNVSAHSLFAIPGDQEADFVFLYQEIMPEENSWMHYIKTFCEMSNERVAAGLSPRPNTPKAAVHREMSHQDYVGRFRYFLLTHVKLALGKGFEDNAPRVDERKHFFLLPKLGDWTKVYQTLKGLLLNLEGPVELSHKKVLRNLPRYLDVDAAYLESQCNKGFHKVFSVYTKNVPSHYSEEEHRKRVNQAIDAFLCISRAPGIVNWLEKLAEKCDKFWKRGRQQCATASLHRHLCINPRHQVEAEDHLEVLPHVILDDSLPEMKHSTGNRLTSYCNCGRRSGTRDEPFTIREANYEFYQRMNLDCCEKLDGWKVPVFEGRRDEKGEGLTLEEMLRILLEKKKEPIPRQEEEEGPISQSQALERDLRQEEEEDEEAGELEFQEDQDDFAPPPEEQTSQQPMSDDHDEHEEITLIEEKVEALSQKEVPALLPPLPLAERDSTVIGESGGREYLPGMLHSRCPVGLLPLFPSWSLLRFGSGSVYAHATGILHQPGFLAGTAFLLPWDVRVKAEIGFSKFVPRLIRGKTQSRRIRHIQDEFNVKVFIGFEYECRKGHRFMLESADKVLQATSSNFGLSIREAATKAATSDMPLYFKCPCNTQVTGEQMTAQLLRLHIVTPKAPVHVQLIPRVQPGQGGPYFTPGNIEPIKLAPSVYWILRLPYAYVTEEQIYTPPNEKNGFNGRIMRGLFNVVSMNETETINWESSNLTAA